jgi:hypothetical protein
MGSDLPKELEKFAHPGTLRDALRKASSSLIAQTEFRQSKKFTVAVRHLTGRLVKTLHG